MGHNESIDQIGRLLTQEEYEDLEATVRRHHEYLEKIVDILRDQELELARLRRARGEFPGAKY